MKSASGMVQKTNVQSEEKNYCRHPATSWKPPGDEIISLPELRQPLQGHFLALLCFISFLHDGTSGAVLIHSHSKIDVLVVLRLPWFWVPWKAEPKRRTYGQVFCLGGGPLKQKVGKASREPGKERTPAEKCEAAPAHSGPHSCSLTRISENPLEVSQKSLVPRLPMR